MYVYIYVHLPRAHTESHGQIQMHTYIQKLSHTETDACIEEGRERIRHFQL